MESAYTLANRELLKRREQNKEEYENRRVHIRATSPEYAEVEAKLSECGTALVRSVLNGGAGYDKIEKTIKTLQDKKVKILKGMKLPEDYLDEIYTCSLCRDTGFSEDGKRCGCLLNLVMQFTGAEANLTDFMKEQTFDKVDYELFALQPEENGRQPLKYMKTAFERGLAFAETFEDTGANLLLMGNAGTGKTFLSSCIANHAIGRGKTVYYQTAFQMFELLEKLKFNRLDGEELDRANEIYKQIYRAELLIIDDLGTEFVTAYSAAALFDIINSRQMHNKSTLISTNLNSEALENAYSKRFTSRLWGNFEIIRLIGQDLRMQKHLG